MTRIHLTERVRVETDLGDDVVGVRLLALQGVEKARIRYQRVTLREASCRSAPGTAWTRARPADGPGPPAGGVASPPTTNASTTAGGLEECHDVNVRAGRGPRSCRARPGTTRKRARRGERSLDRPLDAVLGERLTATVAPSGNAPTFSSIPFTGITSKRGAARRRAAAEDWARKLCHSAAGMIHLGALESGYFQSDHTPSATPRLLLQARAAWARGDAVADDRTRRQRMAICSDTTIPGIAAAIDTEACCGWTQREAADRAELGGRRRGAGGAPAASSTCT